MDKNNLILIGGGGHCKSVIDVAESAGYNILGILDRPELKGQSVLGYTVIGSDGDMSTYVHEAQFLITVGFIKSPDLRVSLYNQVKAVGGQFATVIASTAHVSKYAKIGEGSVVMHNVCVNSDALIGNNVILNTFCNIEHGVKVGDHSHISTGSMINGDCVIGNEVFVGSQSVICNGIDISDNVIIGAGSVVTSDIPTKGTYIGSPAHKLK